MASFPCGKCFLECEGEKAIACDNCDKWFHQKCESLSNIHFSVLGKSSFFRIFVLIVVWILMEISIFRLAYKVYDSTETLLIPSN